MRQKIAAGSKEPSYDEDLNVYAPWPDWPKELMDYQPGGPEKWFVSFDIYSWDKFKKKTIQKAKSILYSKHVLKNV